MRKSAKYVVLKKKKDNSAQAFDAYKNIAFLDGGIPRSVADVSVVAEKEEKHHPAEESRKQPTRYPDYYKPASGLGIVDIYQSESSNEDEGVNVLRVELTDGTIREFRVKNGSKGDEGCAGLGGIRGPRGATGPIGPKGDPPSVSFRYDAETGNVYYTVSDAKVLDEEAF